MEALSIETIKSESERVFRKYGVLSARLFGSYARGEANNASDIDILVQVKRGTFYSDIARLEDELSEIFGRNVDIATTGCHRLLRYIDNDLQALYEV